MALDQRVGKVEWWLITAMFSLLTLVSASGAALLMNHMGKLEERLTALEIKETQTDGKIALLNYMIINQTSYRPSAANAGGNDTYTITVPVSGRGGGNDKSADDYRSGR